MYGWACVSGQNTTHWSFRIQNIYRPIRIEALKQDINEITLKNYMSFTNIKDYIQTKYEITCDGQIVESGEITIPSIEPHQIATVKLPMSVPEKGQAYLKGYYHSTKEVQLVPAGHMLGLSLNYCAFSNVKKRMHEVINLIGRF